MKALAVIQTVSPGAEQVFELSTKDVSSGGAFFPMEAPLSIGTKVRITLYLSFPAIRDFPKMAKVTTEGQVVRSNEQGIAVAFSGRYAMSPAPE